MTEMTAVYDDGFLYVMWKATGVREDYGVPGSPRWWSPEDPEVHSISVRGEDIEYDELPDYMRDAVDNTHSKLEWYVE